jgi:hypothetical protein
LRAFGSISGIEQVWFSAVRRFAMGKDEQAVGLKEGGQQSGVDGGNPANPGPSEIHPHAEQTEGMVNPSAPGETGTTPGTNGK